MTRAFVLEPTEHSTDKAKKFGRVEHIFTDPRQHPHPKYPEFQTCVVERLRALSFDPDQDYLVMTGRTPALIALVAAVVSAFGTVKSLQFDGREEHREYELVALGTTLS